MSESGYWRMYGSDRSPLLHDRVRAQVRTGDAFEGAVVGVALGGELGDGKHGRVRVSHALFWVAL